MDSEHFIDENFLLFQKIEKSIHQMLKGCIQIVC